MEVSASASRRRNNSICIKISLLILVIFHFSSTITAIRKDVGFQIIHPCKTTVQGRYLLSDDNGWALLRITFFFSWFICDIIIIIIFHKVCYQCSIIDWLHCFVGCVRNATSVNSRSRCCPQRGEKFSCQWVFLFPNWFEGNNWTNNNHAIGILDCDFWFYL